MSVLPTRCWDKSTQPRAEHSGRQHGPLSSTHCVCPQDTGGTSPQAHGAARQNASRRTVKGTSIGTRLFPARRRPPARPVRPVPRSVRACRCSSPRRGVRAVGAAGWAEWPWCFKLGRAQTSGSSSRAEPPCDVTCHPYLWSTRTWAQGRTPSACCPTLRHPLSCLGGLCTRRHCAHHGASSSRQSSLSPSLAADCHRVAARPGTLVQSVVSPHVRACVAELVRSWRTTTLCVHPPEGT